MNYVPVFRADVSEDEARELEPMMRQAFNAGLIRGYAQAKEEVRDHHR